MSENETPPSQGAPAAGEVNPGDEIKNLKAEFNRKMSNIEQTNAQLLALLQSQQQAKQQPAPAPAADSDIEKDWFERPTAAAEKLVSKAVNEATRAIHERDNMRNAYINTVQPLYQEYPELANAQSEFAKAAVAKLPANMKEEDYYRNPALVKAAVLEAAMEKGILPMSKRKQTDSEGENFTVSSNSRATERAKSKESKDLDQRTEDFARLLGKNLIDIDNAEVRKRIVGKHGRKSYKDWG